MAANALFNIIELGGTYAEILSMLNMFAYSILACIGCEFAEGPRTYYYVYNLGGGGGGGGGLGGGGGGGGGGGVLWYLLHGDCTAMGERSTLGGRGDYEICARPLGC